MRDIPIILASASPRRSELLRELGIPFTVVAGSAPEVEPAHLTPAEMCMMNAHRKAAAIARLHPDAVVLGADTLVFLDQTVFAKPPDRADAARMLQSLQGKSHQVVTGVCLIHAGSGSKRLFHDSTQVRFRPLDDAAISRYHALINPLDKAGAYAIQEHGDQIVESITGSFSNVVGLPVERLRDELPMFLSTLSSSS